MAATSTAPGDLVPVIDLGRAHNAGQAGRAELADAIDLACRQSGFFAVTHHGVSPGLIAGVVDVSSDFFRQPEDIKSECAADRGGHGMRGLFRRPSYVAAASNLATPPDLCETYIMSRLGEPGIAEKANLGDARERWSTPNRWPRTPASFREQILLYYRAMEGLSTTLMRLFALGLGLPEDWFNDKCDQHISNLCVNWYPPLNRRPLPGQLRKGEHSDWGTLTVLFEDGTSGLQIRDRDGHWFDVPHVDGGLIINIGDMMSGWTGNRWRSTTHRVVLPADLDVAATRMSIAFFHTPNWDADVACLPADGRPVDRSSQQVMTAGAYLDSKLASTKRPGGSVDDRDVKDG